MATGAASLPHVSLTRPQWLRLVVVGVFVAFAVGRVVPDVIRAFEPLGIFGYVTDANGVVLHVASENKGDRILLGDRVRVDRIKPFDRKPGFVGLSYSYDNRDRLLPIERHSRMRYLHLVARNESVASRVMTLLRILIFVIVVGFGAILFLVQPGIATAAIFAYTLSGDFPTTYADLYLPNPWRAIPEWIALAIAGAGRTALLIFAVSLLVESQRLIRLFVTVAGTVGIGLGLLDAYAFWLETYAGRASQSDLDLYGHASSVITTLTIGVFVLAFARARGEERQRIGLIVASFALAGGARLASDALFPSRILPWENGILLTLTVLPIVTVWYAVVRHRFFNVDFVVSRAVVYVALTAAIIAAISLSEELGTYLFYNNTDITYGFLTIISMGVGACTGRIVELVRRFVDRFIFRERRAQRQALELIGGYILDAETIEDVHRALLQDAAHALNLSFAGIFSRMPDGGYELGHEYDWPPDGVRRFAPADDLTRDIARSRGALNFSGKQTARVKKYFPNERLTFAAPLFFDRNLSEIVVFGKNVSGLDLDPDERELLVRVVAHASIALNTIELARYRAARIEPLLPA